MARYCASVLVRRHARAPVMCSCACVCALVVWCGERLPVGVGRPAVGSTHSGTPAGRGIPPPHSPRAVGRVRGACGRPSDRVVRLRSSPNPPIGGLGRQTEPHAPSTTRPVHQTADPSDRRPTRAPTVRFAGPPEPVPPRIPQGLVRQAGRGLRLTGPLDGDPHLVSHCCQQTPDNISPGRNRLDNGPRRKSGARRAQSGAVHHLRAGVTVRHRRTGAP